MVIDEEVYLAHHGVKGMRWGVRKKENSSTGDAPNSNHTKAKVIASVAVTASVVVGSLYVKHLLNQRGVNRLGGSTRQKMALGRELRDMHANELESHSDQLRSRAEKLIKSTSHQKVNNIMGATRYGEITKAQSDRLRLLNIKEEMNRTDRLNAGKLTAADYNRLRTAIVRNYFQK